MARTITKENDYQVRLTFNFENKKCDLTVYIDRKFVHWCKRRGMGASSELVYLVPEVLRTPACIFRGLRWEQDEPRRGHDRPGWICYCGAPGKAFRSNGTEIDPYVDEVFLVFLDDEKYVYGCGWEDADQVDNVMPMNWDDVVDPRFKELIYQKSEIVP